MLDKYDKHVFVMQGIEFLQRIHTIYTNREVNREILDFECCQWLELFLQLVPLTVPDPMIHLKLFIGGQEPVMNDYKHFSQKYVSMIPPQRIMIPRFHTIITGY